MFPSGRRLQHYTFSLFGPNAGIVYLPGRVILLTVELRRFATQMLAPSKMTPSGEVPTG
jgi:hypothetical protein